CHSASDSRRSAANRRPAQPNGVPEAPGVCAHEYAGLSVVSWPAVAAFSGGAPLQRSPGGNPTDSIRAKTITSIGRSIAVSDPASAGFFFEGIRNGSWPPQMVHLAGVQRDR